MELDEIFPEKPEFVLKSTGKTHELRLVNLQDHVWVKANLGDEKAVATMLRDVEWDKIMRFAYRLLKDKSDFMAYSEDIINDDGVCVTVLVTGPEVLLRHVNGLEEGILVLGALVKAISLSNPVIDEMVKEEVKKNSPSKSTGQKLSTSSPQITAGPQDKSQSLQ